MKNLIFLSKAFVTIVAMLSIGLSAFAYSFEAGGIYYNITNSTNKTVEVTSGTSLYSGSVSIPSSVTYNGTNYSVTEIGYWAFQYCTGLTSVTIPNSVTKVGNYAFDGCSGLKELIIEDGTETLSLGYNEYDDYYYGKGLFYDCPIEKLYLGRNLWYHTGSDYGYSPFFNCDELTSVTIGNSVTSIDDYAFFSCNGLTSVTIPNSVTSIGSYAFDGCSGLTEVNITDLSAWCKIDFGNYSANPLYYEKKLKLNGTVITNLVIPNDITQIKDYAFYGYTGLTSVTIPNSVTTIGDEAFRWCYGLKELIIEDGTETLSLGYNEGYGLFCDCPIEKLYLGRNLSYYTGDGISPFYNNAKLKEVTIGNSVTEIGHYAFMWCEGLTSITIPNSVVRIRYKAFYGCDGLTSIIIPNSVTEIGNKAFCGCKGLTKVTIPNSVPVIGEMTFCNCTSLTSITIGNSVTKIGDNTFYNCTSLTSITIGNSVTEIGNDAFYNTGWYNNQPDGILYLDNCCLGYKGNKPTGSLLIKKGTRLIGPDAFSDCSGLTSVTIPISVISIGNSAFTGCSLRLVQTLCMTPPACGTSAFDGCYSALLMIPEGTMIDYALADGWCNFTKVQEGVTTGVEGIKTEDNALEISRYDIHGRLLSEPTKGINILKMSDGTTRTELVK